ncbi:MAG: DUF58 domain-containing protein, partial [Steroidobacteraceae bacterium]
MEGDRLTVTVTLAAITPLPLVEVAEKLPPSIRLASGASRVVRTLDAGEKTQWHYEIECDQSGRISPGRLHVRLPDRSGLRRSALTQDESAPLAVYPRFAPLRRLLRPLQTQASFGSYVSRRTGEGLEPGDTRLFAPGDRVRQVNWRASLRLQKLYVTRHHEERNADIVLLLDTLADAGPRTHSSLDRCRQACAAIALAYLARRDRVGLIEYGGYLQWIAPRTGRHHGERLLDALLAAKVTFSYLTRDLRRVPPQALPQQAFIIALSALLDERFIKALTDLAGRGFDIVLMALRPDDLIRPMIGRSRLNDLACRIWALDWRRQINALRHSGITVLEWPADEAPGAVLAGMGQYRLQRRP